MIGRNARDSRTECALAEQANPLGVGVSLAVSVEIRPEAGGSTKVPSKRGR